MQDEPTTPPEPQEPQEPQEPPGMTVDELLKLITPRAWVTPAVAVLIVIGFAFELAMGVSLSKPTGGELLKAGGEYGPLFVQGQYWRAVTSMFLHSGPLHLAFNLWAFLIVGKLTERIYGNTSFFAIYMLSGIGASLTSLAWSPLVVGVGASGAVFGVYGALLAFVLLHRGVFPAEYLARQRNSVLGFIGYNVVFALSQKDSRIDMAAHAGGLVTGALIGSLLARDVLRPSEHATRRAVSAVGFAVLVVLAGVYVRGRVLNVPEIKADRAADAALARLKAKDYAPAINLYTQALVFVREPDWLLNRSIAYFAVDDLKNARQDALDSDVAKPIVNTKAMLCDIGLHIGGTPEQLEETAKYCTAAIDLEQVPAKKARLFTSRAIVRGMQSKHAAESLADADAALALDSGSQTARSQRAALLLDNRRIPEAEQECARLLASPDPTRFDLSTCTEVAHERADRPAERLRLDRWLASAPADDHALRKRAYLNAEEGRLAEAVADYDKLVGVDPKAGVWNNRAWLRVELGDFAAARADADRAVALEPDSPHALGTRCFALVGLGELAAARADCARSVALNGESAMDRGMLAFLDKRYGEARREWQAASRSSPADARSLRPWLAKLPGG